LPRRLTPMIYKTRSSTATGNCRPGGGFRDTSAVEVPDAFVVTRVCGTRPASSGSERTPAARAPDLSADVRPQRTRGGRAVVRQSGRERTDVVQVRRSPG
jgi:hypothetical protein